MDETAAARFERLNASALQLLALTLRPGVQEAEGLRCLLTEQVTASKGDRKTSCARS